MSQLRQVARTCAVELIGSVVHDTVPVQVNLIELGEAVIQFKSDIAVDLASPAADLCDPVFKTLGQANLDTMFIASHANDRFSDNFANTLCNATPGSAFHVHLKFEFRKYRIEYFVAHLCVHAKDIREWLSLAAVRQFDQRFSLGVVCFHINNDLATAFTLMDRARPVVDRTKDETVQIDASVVTIVYTDKAGATAIAVGRCRLKLAWTTVVAVAVAKFHPV
jgi:hypothetical protein